MTTHIGWVINWHVGRIF